MTSKNSAKKPANVYHEGAIYQAVETTLCTTYTKLQDIQEVEKLTPVWNGKKIPLHMWKEILAFMKQSYNELKSETLLYLFYDEAASQPWLYWVPPQETAGMTVKSSPDHPDYIKQRAAYPDTMFGTVHHHCSTSAFQSGTDEADEVNREGLHFTVGNLNNSDTVDVHFRITLGGTHAELDAHTYIEMDESPFKKTCRVPQTIQNQARTELHKMDVCTLPDIKQYKFETEMQNVSKKTYTPITHAPYSQRSLGWDYEPISKKNMVEDENMLDDQQILAETFVESVLTDWHFEEILQSYYQYTNDTLKISDLMHAQLEEEDVRVDLITMFNDTRYTNSQEYAETLTSIQMFLQEQSNLGVAFSTKELIHGLNTISYDQGTGVQQMDKENVL
jgi:hypothetical protein